MPVTGQVHRGPGRRRSGDSGWTIPTDAQRDPCAGRGPRAPGRCESRQRSVPAPDRDSLQLGWSVCSATIRR